MYYKLTTSSNDDLESLEQLLRSDIWEHDLINFWILSLNSSGKHLLVHNLLSDSLKFFNASFDALVKIFVKRFFIISSVKLMGIVKGDLEGTEPEEIWQLVDEESEFT